MAVLLCLGFPIFKGKKLVEISEREVESENHLGHFQSLNGQALGLVNWYLMGRG